MLLAIPTSAAVKCDISSLWATTDSQSKAEVVLCKADTSEQWGEFGMATYLVMKKVTTTMKGFSIGKRFGNHDTTPTQMPLLTSILLIVCSQVDVVMPKPQFEIECQDCSVWGGIFELADNLIA